MAKSLSTSLVISTTAALTRTEGLCSATGSLSDSISKSIPNALADNIFTASVEDEDTPTVYNIHDGGLIDTFGDEVEIDNLTLLIIENLHATGYLKVTGLPTTIISSSAYIMIPPTGCFVWNCNLGVTGSPEAITLEGVDEDDDPVECSWKIIAVGLKV